MTGLNRIYRLIWSRTRGCLIVVSEAAKSCAMSIGCGLLTCSAAIAAPVGGQVASGQADIIQSSGHTQVNQHSNHTSLEWQSFDVAAGETVNFSQPSSSSIAVNRIHDVNGSQIHGQLSANGQVWLVNPNGVLFGESAQVDVGGLVATTLNPLSDNFAQQQRFAGDSKAAIINRGQINTASGYTALLGHQVINEGVISARLGSVALAGGSDVTVTFDDNRLLSVQVNENQLDALVENQQLIQADGGQVLMSAGARDSLLASAVNNEGIVQAQTVEQREGKIILLAGMEVGTTTVTGTLDASAATGDGGFIETSAAQVKVASEAHVTTYSQQGETGNWLIDPDEYIIANGGDKSPADLVSELALNNITIATTAGQDLKVLEDISWSAGTNLKLSADGDLYINGKITASGASDITLSAGSAGSGNIEINSEISTAGRLFLEYGENYLINAPVSLLSGINYFSQKYGESIVSYQVINTLSELSAIGAGANYALGGMIDATSTKVGSSFTPIAGFNSSFDGLGNSIDQLYINKSGSKAGLFKDLPSSSVIRNLKLTNVDVTGTSQVGALAGEINNGEIDNVYISGKVEGTNRVGGLVGRTGGNGTISRVRVQADITGSGDRVGGITGNARGAVIRDSRTSGVVKGSAQTGGLVGLSSSNIFDSYSSAQVEAHSGVAGDGFGGLVGNQTSKTITSSYSTGSVKSYTGNSNIGGLVGRMSGSSRITQSYSTADVQGDSDIGGLVGHISSSSSSVSDSYAADGDIKGDSNVGGLVGLSVGTITRTYSTSNVVPNGATNEAGLVGFSMCFGNNCGVTDSYWDDSYVVGINIFPGAGTYVGNNTLSSASYVNWGDAVTRTQGAQNTVWRFYVDSSNNLQTLPVLRSFLTRLDVANQNVTYDGAGHQLSLPSGTNLANIFDQRIITNVSDTPIHLYSNQQGYDIVGGQLRITPKQVTVSGRKVYDGGTGFSVVDLRADELIGLDTATVSGTTTLTNKDVGMVGYDTSGLSLSNSNYELVAGNTIQITPKKITVSGSKTYDGGTGFTVADLTADGLIGSDTATVSGTTTLTNKDVGTVGYDASGLSLSNGNYEVVAGNTIQITPKRLSVSGSKVYDGNNSFEIDNLAVDGVVSGDMLSLSTGTVALSSAGVGTTELISYNLGSSNSNYIIDASRIEITAKSISLKVSSSAFTGEAVPQDLVISSDDFVSGDQVSISYQNASFKTQLNGFVLLDVEGVSLLGSDAANYNLADTRYIQVAAFPQRAGEQQQAENELIKLQQRELISSQQPLEIDLVEAELAGVSNSLVEVLDGGVLLPEILLGSRSEPALTVPSNLSNNQQGSVGL